MVTNSGSDDVYVLPGVGGGFFDDTSPRVIRVGSAPVQSVVGDVDGDGRPDLVTINSGSSTLTFFSGLDAPNPLAQTFGSGGLRPTVGLAGDFNGDGRLDLLVGNSGDGRLALFFGGPGLTLAASLTSSLGAQPDGAGLRRAQRGHPVVLRQQRGARRGGAAVVRPAARRPSEPGGLGPGDPGRRAGVALEDILGAGPPGPTAPGAEAPAAPTLVQVAQLLPLGGSSLALVATLLTVAVGAEAAAEPEGGVPSDAATALVLLVTALGPAAAGVGGPGGGGRSGSDGEEPGPEPEQELESSETTLAEALQVVFGLEEAWQEARREARELFLGESEAAERPGRGAAVIAAVDAVLERWSPWCDLLAPTSSATLRLAARAVAAAMEAIEDAGRPDPGAGARRRGGRGRVTRNQAETAPSLRRRRPGGRGGRDGGDHRRGSGPAAAPHAIGPPPAGRYPMPIVAGRSTVSHSGDEPIPRHFLEHSPIKS